MGQRALLLTLFVFCCAATREAGAWSWPFGSMEAPFCSFLSWAVPVNRRALSRAAAVGFCCKHTCRIESKQLWRWLLFLLLRVPSKLCLVNILLLFLC